MDLARDRILPDGTHWISDQFPDRLALGEDRDGAAREVAELGAGVDPQVAVDRRQQVLRRQGRSAGILAPRVRRAR